MRSRVYHHKIHSKESHSKEHSEVYLWEQTDLPKFHELILSWNASRPLLGGYTIFVSLKVNEWSEWLSYAYWGSDQQHGGNSTCSRCQASVFQDTLSLKKGTEATGFRIKIESLGGASLLNFHRLHACITNENEGLRGREEIASDASTGYEIASGTFRSSAVDTSTTSSRTAPSATSRLVEAWPSIFSQPLRDLEEIKGIKCANLHLQVPLISQMTLPHPRCRDLCSPTSVTSVINFLSPNQEIDPIIFALEARDHTFDIFGNWVLNIAQASALLGGEWSCWVERLHSFEDIYERLCQNTPVVISLRGPLLGSALPYHQGHLMVIKGYDANSNRVHCMDPAFASSTATDVTYSLEDFMQAWARRGYVAYLFEKNH